MIKTKQILYTFLFFLIRLSKLSKTCVLLFKKIVLHAFAL